MSKEMDETRKVYDFLGALGEDARRFAVEKLFALAGRIGHLADGYFFEKHSCELLDEAAKTKVYDESGNLAGEIPTPHLFFELVILGKDPRFDPANHQYRQEPRFSKEELETLWRIQDILHKELKRRGNAVREEYALVADLLGAKRLASDEAEALAGKIADRIQELLAQARGA